MKITNLFVILLLGCVSTMDVEEQSLYLGMQYGVAPSQPSTANMVGRVPPTPLGGIPAAVTPSCSANINRIKFGNGAPANWSAIAKSTTTVWTDPSFTSANYITWAGFSNSVGSTLVATTYTRVKTTSPAAILFNTTQLRQAFDIDQRALGDCYFLSSASLVANQTARIKAIFKQTTLNAAGIIVAVVFVKGIPTIVAVDDNLPYANNAPAFATIAPDNAVWGPFIEKVWAKVNVNYETIASGSPVEAFDFFLGTPLKQYMMNGVDIGYDAANSATFVPAADKAWAIVQDALRQQFLVEVGTGATTINNVVANHAYSILGVFNVTDATGNIFHLYQVRNPWGFDSTYNGPWADTDTTHWTTATKAQVPYSNNANDGVYFIEYVDFVKVFISMQVGFWKSTYINNFLAVNADDGTQKNFQFKIAKPAEVFVYLSFYNPRMYPSGCRSGQDESSGKIQLFNISGFPVGPAIIATDDLQNQKFIHIQVLPPGIYVLVSYGVSWAANDVPDFTVRVYGSAPTTIVQQTPLQVGNFSALMLSGIFKNGVNGCTPVPTASGHTTWQSQSCYLDGTITTIIILKGLQTCSQTVTYTITGAIAAPISAPGTPACTVSGSTFVCPCNSLSQASQCGYLFDSLSWSASISMTTCA